jgi:cytochrome c oxidase assembly protein subunit 15
MLAGFNTMSKSIPSAALRRYSWLTTFYFVLVILWGTVVRATGSGNGCGEHWPLCGGAWFPGAMILARTIEFAHRATSGLSGIAVLVLLVWCWCSTARAHLARWSALAAAILTLNEGLVGALLVLWGKTAGDQSPARTFLLTTHMTNTLLMVAALALTAHLLSRDTGFTWKTIQLHQPLRNLAGLAVIVFTCTAGAVAALGDTLFPATNLTQALIDDFSVTSNWLLRYRWTHPALALVAAAYVIRLLLQALRSKGSAENRPLVTTISYLLALQFLLGILDAVLLAPIWLQVTHLVCADSLWIVLVVLVARLTLIPKEI